MKLQKKTLVAAILLATSSLVQAGFSGNVALTTDYVWRGISQAGEDIAIQGGFDFEHESGAYAGVWASNVDYNAPGTVETDLYFGFANALGDFSYDVWYIDYLYPDNGAINFDEVGFSVGYDFKVISFSAGISSNDIIVENDDIGTYYEAGVDVPIGSTGISIAGHVGKYDLQGGAENYVDWKLGVAADFAGFGFDLSYSDTDLGNIDIADKRVFLTVSKAL